MSNMDLLHAGMVTEAFREPVMLLDRTLCVTAWNTMCEAVFEKPAQQVLGTPVFSLFPDAADNPKIINALKRTLDGYSSFLEAENGGFARGDFDHHFSPLKDGNGAIIGAMVAGHDISHRVKAIKELQQLNKALAKKNQELANLAATLQEICKAIGRNLYEPLGRMYSFTNLVLSGEQLKLSEDGKKYFHMIRKLIRKSKDLTADLLAYISVEEDQEPFKEVDLNQIFSFIRNTLHEELSAAGVALSWEKLPVVYGNRRLLYQVFLELVKNALKFRRPDRPAVIEITGGLTPIESLSADRPLLAEFIWIKVKDNGPGIRQEAIPDVFRLFYRASSRKDLPGNGVGLALCKKIIEQHKGTIHAQSATGTGTTVICCLPGI
jgi:signal transduction histidine kinase